MKMRFVGALVAVAALSAGTAHATSIVFNDFSPLSGMQLNGITDDIHTCDAGGNTGCDAVTDDLNRDVLRLTNNYGQSGSAFSQSAVALTSAASFSSAFTFRISSGAGEFGDGDGPGADGLVFAVQTVSNTAGGAGGGIGYDGLLRSVGIEFDTYNNGGVDGNNGNHVGIDINGNISSQGGRRNVPLSDPADGTPFGRLNNGEDWTAWVDYDGSTQMLEVRLSNTTSRPVLAYLSYEVDLLGVLDPDNTGEVNAFVGFTSGTGSGRGNHDIVSWQFNDNFQPIDQIGEGVPVPGAVALLGLGLLGFGGLRRRK